MSMQNLNTHPVKVNIKIENQPLLEKQAFNSSCFIFNVPDDVSVTGDIVLTSLSDITGTYAEYVQVAYDFAESFFSQNTYGLTLYLRGKHSGESYASAYLASASDNYYFVCIESKDIDEVLGFNDVLVSELKLQFFSSDQDYAVELANRKIAYFYYGSSVTPPDECEGAVNSVYMWIAVRDGTTPEILPTLYIDGVLADVNNPPAYIGVEFPETGPQPTVPAGFTLAPTIQKLINNDSVTHKFKVENTADMLVLASGNGSVATKDDFSEVFWCLSGQDSGPKYICNEEDDLDLVLTDGDLLRILIED